MSLDSARKIEAAEKGTTCFAPYGRGVMGCERTVRIPSRGLPRKRVEMSLDTARRSACATSSVALFERRDNLEIIGREQHDQHLPARSQRPQQLSV